MNRNDELVAALQLANSENALRAILREYLAITLQEIGLRGAARYLRARPLRRHSSPSMRAGAGDSAPTSTDLHASDDETQQPDSGVASAMEPFVVDIDSERRLQFSHDVLQSRMRLTDPHALIAPYTRQMMSFLLFNPDPAEILMVGLGGGSLPKFCYRHLPHARITVVEIDARVIAMRGLFSIPPDDHRFRVIHDDGAKRITRLDRPVDAILIDAFDAAGVSPSLATLSFFRDASRHLTPNGVLIMNLHGNPRRFSAHLKRVRAVFGARALLASVASRDNVLLFAFGENATPPAARQLVLRARHLQSKLPLNFRSYLQRIREGSGLG